MVSERNESEGDCDGIDSDGLKEISNSSNSTVKNANRHKLLKDTDEDENEFVIC